MGSVYALLVGIDAYPLPMRRLFGCNRDIDRVHAYLSTSVASDQLSVRQLRDGQATRAAVIDGFRSHLSQARDGDTALFWFSGHGSHAPVWPEHAAIEPTGLMQTLVCVDSRRRGVIDLLDKEIDILLGELAARHAHIATVFDCCHAKGMTRSVTGVRHVEDLTAPPPLHAVLPELRGAYRDGPTRPHRPADHVALAACASKEQAQELENENGQMQGVFSAALVGVLARSTVTPTYRELLVEARCQVQNRVVRQIPTIFPPDGALIDQPFLGGAARPAASPVSMRNFRDTWEINVGSIHGFSAGSTDDRTVMAVHDSDPPLTAVVETVYSTHSVVRPLAWEPDPHRRYDMVLVGVPMPAVTVAFGSGPADELLRTAVRRSLHLRAVARVGKPEADMQVTTEAGVTSVHGLDHTRLLPDSTAPATPEAATTIVRKLEHIATWHQIKTLENRTSRLIGAVGVELVTVGAGLPADWAAQPALAPDGSGAITLLYRRGSGGWLPPEVRIRLRNRSSRTLYCVLLDLTDRYRVYPRLFPGDEIAPGSVAWVDEGNPIRFTLPADRPSESGAQVTDWLKVLIAEHEFTSEPFELSSLGESVHPDRTRAAAGFRGVLDRLGAAATNREAKPANAPAEDWATGMITVVTKIPD